MMQPARLRDRHNRPCLWCSDGAWVGRVLLEAQVRATPMVILHDSSEVTRQVNFAKYDHMIQAFPPHGADYSLDIASLRGNLSGDDTC